MSFVAKKYETNTGDVCRARLSAQVAVLAGNEPAGNITTPFFVKLGKNNREFGIRPRHAVYANSTAVGTRTLKVYKKIVKLTDTAWLASPATIQYGGDDYDLVSLVPEDY